VPRGACGDLVEGWSDQAALEALARRRGRDLLAEGIVVVPIGGATNVQRFVQALVRSDWVFGWPGCATSPSCRTCGAASRAPASPRAPATEPRASMPAMPIWRMS
jgi:hypothetical protein